MFRQKKIVYVNDVDELNQILQVVKASTGIVYDSWHNKLNVARKISLATHSFVTDAPVTFTVTTKYYPLLKDMTSKFSPCTFIFRKDGEQQACISPTACYSTMQRYYNAPDFCEDRRLNLQMTAKGSFALSAAPVVGYNSALDKQEHYVYVYDLNSAYASIMIGKIPDTSSYRLHDVVGEGEIGFLLCDKLPLIHSGYADIVFKLVDSPYKDFAKKYYTIKKYSTGEAKARAKAMLVYSVGYLQRHNPFIRAYIVNSCNEYIESMIDSDTIMWNTDAIYSLKPRDDIEIGNEIGQFKLEYEGYMRHIGCNYQYVDSGKVSYRGIPKKWFRVGFNILTDDLPQEDCNLYYFNKDTFKMEVRDGF